MNLNLGAMRRLAPALLLGVMYATAAASAEVAQEQQSRSADEAYLEARKIDRRNGQDELKDAVRLYNIAASAGHSGACYQLGMLYLEGRGVGKNAMEAKKWFERAESGFYPAATLKLGWIYELGLGVKADPEKKQAYYLKAAQQGSAEAMYRYALGLDAGAKPLAEVTNEKKEWIAKAAEGGYPEAQYQLGIAYRNGELGLEKNQEKAGEWLLKALRQEYLAAESPLQELARDQNADGEFLFKLGVVYAMGHGVQKDPGRALELFRLGAEKGDVTAQFNYAVMLEKGMAGEKDEAAAQIWYIRSAQGGYGRARALLEKRGIRYAPEAEWKTVFTEAGEYSLLLNVNSIQVKGAETILNARVKYEKSQKIPLGFEEYRSSDRSYVFNCQERKSLLRENRLYNGVRVVYAYLPEDEKTQGGAALNGFPLQKPVFEAIRENSVESRLFPHVCK